MDYYKKYIKYKNKYLKIIKGGIRKENIDDRICIVFEHGTLLPDSTITVPHNIKLIISNQCGMTSYGEEVQSSKYLFLESSIDKRMILTKDEFYNLVNTKYNEVVISGHTYKIIEPNTQICNVRLTADLQYSGLKKFNFASYFQNIYNRHDSRTNKYILKKFIFYTGNIEKFKKLITEEFSTLSNKYYISQNIIFYEFMFFIKYSIFMNSAKDGSEIYLKFHQILTDEEIKKIIQLLIVKLMDPNPNIIFETLLKYLEAHKLSRQNNLDELSRLEQTDYSSLSMYNVCIILFLYLYEYNEFLDTSTLNDKLSEISTEIQPGKIGYVLITSCLVVPTGETSLTSVKKCLDKYYQLESEIPSLTISMINSKLNTKFNISNYLIAPAEVIMNKIILNKDEFSETIRSNIKLFNLIIMSFMNNIHKENNKIGLFIKDFFSDPENIKTLDAVNFGKLNLFHNTTDDINLNIIEEYNSPIYYLIVYTIINNKRLNLNITEECAKLADLIYYMGSERLSNMQKLTELQKYQKLVMENRNKFLIFEMINFKYMESILNDDVIREEQLPISTINKVISKNISRDGVIIIDGIFTKTKKPEMLQLVFLSNENFKKEIKIKQNTDVKEDFAIIEEDYLTIDEKSYNNLFKYFFELPYNRLLVK